MVRAGMLTFFLVLTLAAPAGAHDGSHVSAASGDGEELDASVTMRTAHFFIPGYRTGNFLTVAPVLRIGTAQRVWGLLSVPVHYLTFVGVSDVGVGDLVGACGYGLLRRELFSLDVALWTMWPLGDSHASLGSAHLMIAPEVEARLHRGRFSGGLSATLRGAIPWGEHGLHAHQPLVAPHDLLDVRFRARAAVQLFGVLEVGANAEPVVVAIPHPVQPVGTRLSAGLDAALTLGHFRLDASVAVPLTRNRAWEWQAGAALTYRVSAASTDPKTVRP